MVAALTDVVLTVVEFTSCAFAVVTQRLVAFTVVALTVRTFAVPVANSEVVLTVVAVTLPVNELLFTVEFTEELPMTRADALSTAFAVLTPILRSP